MAFIRGKNKAEAFDGTSGNDTIEGRGGNDTLRGLGGDDLLKGGSGNDEVFGGDGDDYVHGGSGEDLLFGDAGNDSLLGANGDDTLDGGSGSDTLRGGKNDDTLIAGEGNDTLDGGSETDTVIFSGNRQDYTITQINATTVIIEGPDGTDRVTRVEIFQFADITQSFAEVIQPYDYAEFGLVDPSIMDSVSDFDLGRNSLPGMRETGAEIATVVYINNTGTIGETVTVKTYLSTDGTLSGDDLLLATEVMTIPVGLQGTYEPLISIPDTVLSGDYKLITVVEYPGELDLSNNTVVQDITLVGGRLEGTVGDDVIATTEFSDLVDGGAGNDTILASEGTDEIEGGDGQDIVDYSGSDTSMFLFADVATDRITVQDPGANNVAYLSGIEGVIGTQFDDSMLMELGLTYADGGAGNDTIQGGAVDDTIFGGDGDDALVGFSGSDSIDGGAGNDTAYWIGNRNEFVVTQIDADTVEIEGANGTDIVTGVENFVFEDVTQSFAEVVVPLEPNVATTALYVEGPVFVEGDSLHAGWNVVSDGDVDADSSTTELVIASAPDMAQVIERFGVTETGALATGTSGFYTGMLDTTGFAPGTYYVAAIADSMGELDESNEADNISGWIEVQVEAQLEDFSLDAVTVLASSDLNLSVDAPGYGEPIQPAGQLDLSMTVSNNGNTGLTQYYVGAYLSTDTVVSADDFQLDFGGQNGASQIFTVDFGTSVSIDVSAELAEQFPQGDYYVIAVVVEYDTGPYGAGYSPTTDNPDDNFLISDAPISLVGGWTYGDDFDDLFTGTEFRETFEGNGGDDTLTGEILDDIFYGGDGVDTLDFSQMDEAVQASGFPDETYSAGIEIRSPLPTGQYGGTSEPQIGYAEEVERVIGSDFDDNLGGGASTLRYFDGGAGNDQIVGSLGDDTMLGGLGDDFLFGNLGDDLITSGDGSDMIYAVSSDAYGTYSPNGHDIVTDFDVSMDMLLIVYSTNVETFDPFANLTQTAEGALVTMSSDASVLLQGVDVFDLNLSNLMGFEDNPYTETYG